MADVNWCECKLTNRGYVVYKRWCVCSHCGLPAEKFMENIVTNFSEYDDSMLHWFNGGEHHNEIWTTKQLLYRNDELPSATWIVDYAWTDRTVTGSKSGRTARVWEHRTS